jgi:rod shape-determining protein MreD
VLLKALYEEDQMLFLAIAFLTGIGLTIVESVFIPSVSIAGIRPDLVVLVIVVATCRLDYVRVLGLAFVLGLVRDIYSLGFVGMSPFSLVLMAYILLVAEEYFMTDNWKAQVFVGFLGYLIFGSLFAFLTILGGLEIAPALKVAEIVLGTAVYTSALVPLGFIVSDRPEAPAYMRLRKKYNAEHETLHQTEV